MFRTTNPTEWNHEGKEGDSFKHFDDESDGTNKHVSPHTGFKPKIMA